MTAMIAGERTIPDNMIFDEDGALVWIGQYRARPHGEHEHKCTYCKGQWDCDCDLRKDGTCPQYDRDRHHCSAECERMTRKGRTWRTERVKVATHRSRRTR